MSSGNWKSEIVTRFGGNNIKFESESIGDGANAKWRSKLFIKGECVFTSENYGNKKSAENEMARKFLEQTRVPSTSSTSTEIEAKISKRSWVQDAAELDERWEAQDRLNSEMAKHIAALYSQIHMLTELLQKK
ncbi:MAG: hypothetical protein Solivirus1_53 [Solivirus sp.]|uniref:Uncharacterized protein n=1 Tax=Solivirus sp. TaxID=2487772 RepID=A0A3G5AFA3_9VIRU|nr:MAG: hypothetical protein Solivirus1_53 [Solivirus sp.]